MYESAVNRDSTRYRYPSLPRGLRQSDCDGPMGPFADADGKQLWLYCTDAQRREIADRFVAARGDDVRDFLLEAQHLDPQQAALPGRGDGERGVDRLGRVLWRAWTTYRDRALDGLLRQGRLEQR